MTNLPLLQHQQFVMNNYSTSKAHVHACRRDKSGTNRRRKSIIADGDFIKKMGDLGYFSAAIRRGHVVVRMPVSLPISHPDSRRTTARPWRDVHEETRGLFYHKALSGQPNVKAFTLMLSRTVEAKARARKDCLAWLHRRVVRQLRRASDHYSGGAVPFWFVIEESDEGRLHVHGEIAIGPIETEGRSVRSIRRVLSPIRDALKAAGGAWNRDRDGEGNQLRFEARTPDIRWAGYCLKCVHRARPERRRYMRRFGFHRWWGAGFEGKAVTASEGLSRSAFALHCMMIRALRAD